MSHFIIPMKMGHQMSSEINALLLGKKVFSHLLVGISWYLAIFNMMIIKSVLFDLRIPVSYLSMLRQFALGTCSNTMVVNNICI